MPKCTYLKHLHRFFTVASVNIESLSHQSVGKELSVIKKREERERTVHVAMARNLEPVTSHRRGRKHTALHASLTDNLSHLSNCQWEIKMRDQSKRLVYLLLLSAQGHCFHGDSLMASFASFLFIYLFTPRPSYLQHLCVTAAHDHCGSDSRLPLFTFRRRRLLVHKPNEDSKSRQTPGEAAFPRATSKCASASSLAARGVASLSKARTRR